MTNTKQLHELITERMRARNLTDIALRDLLLEYGVPVSRQSVREYRVGSRLPSIQQGQGLSRALGIPAARLLEAAALQARMRQQDEAA